ncbi:MAG: phosphopentomutase [Paracoccaceae bacterium]
MKGRVFLIVMDSVGIGGAPDADQYFNDGVPDTGANTLLHIAEACAVGQADIHREGPLKLPNLTALGLGNAIELACGLRAPGIDPVVEGTWGVASETSRGKDTPSGHWELAGLPVAWDWHYFKDKTQSFPEELIKSFCEIAGTDGILGNCHGSGTELIRAFGEQHCSSGWPICYTSADSVFQVAAHETHFGLNRLNELCARFAPEVHRLKVGRVIARPFLGETADTFYRTENRRDFALLPPNKVLTNWVQDAGHPVTAIGKIGDIFSMQGIDKVLKGSDSTLMTHLATEVALAKAGSFIFANFVEFDSRFGHRRDIAGYARALEWFDQEIGQILPQLKANDLMIFTADHGNDPSWIGTDHTRERVPVLCATRPSNPLGHIGFEDVAKLVLCHLNIAHPAVEDQNAV